MSSSEIDQWMRQGKILLDQERYEEALISFEKAVVYNPSDPNAYNEKGKVLYRLNRYSEAIEAEDHAIALAPDSAKFYANKALSLFYMTLYIESLVVFNQAIERGLSIGWVYHYISHILLILKRPAEALDASETALRLDPDAAEIQNGYGNVLRALRRFPEAILAYDQALRLDPGYILSYNGKCSVLYALGHYQEALEIVEKASTLMPLLAETFRGKGLVLWKLERYEDAIVAYDQALHIDSYDIRSYNGKGLSLQKLSRYQEALDVYDTAIALDENDASLWSDRGQCLYQLGRSTEARISFIQSKKVHFRQLEDRRARGMAPRGNTREKAPAMDNDKAADTILFDWERIETWLHRNAPHAWRLLRPGASEQEILQAEAALGFVLPADFKASQRLHNGGYVIDLVTEMNIFSLTDIVDTWRMFYDLEERGTWAEAGVPYDFQKDGLGWQTGPIRPLWWHQYWIPIGKDRAGNLCCLDLTPAPGGVLGQVIDWDHDTGPSRVLASRYAEILSQFAQALEDGKYVDTVDGLQTRSDD